MADEQKPKESKAPKERRKVNEPATEETVLSTTAKAIGNAAGKTASMAGVQPAPAPPHTISTKPMKLQKKNKHRLPRRQKKAQQKAAEGHGGAANPRSGGSSGPPTPHH
jgi:hypothetical protein